LRTIETFGGVSFAGGGKAQHLAIKDKTKLFEPLGYFSVPESGQPSYLCTDNQGAIK